MKRVIEVIAEAIARAIETERSAPPKASNGMVAIITAILRKR